MRLPPRIAILYSLAVLIVSCGWVHAQAYSSLVFPGPDGRLDYAGYSNEGQAGAVNRMIDFSHAGYEGGGVAIPWVPVVAVLDPVAGGGDDHARIQAAIDAVSAMPLSPAGFRGALLLRAGTYNVSETLVVTASGVVIRGEGQDIGGTVINFTATVQDNLFEFLGSQSWTKIGGTETAIVDTLVPTGAYSFNVGSAAGLAIGDRLMVHRTPNQAWIDLLDMAQWGWTAAAYASQTPRRITAIVGNVVSVDAPLVHAIETQYGGGEVYRYHFNGAIRQVGIERLRLESAFLSDTDENHGWSAVLFRRTENAWARQVTARYFGFSCIDLRQGTKHVTVEDCAQLDPKSIITGGRRYSFNLDDASFILVQRCYTENGRHDYATGSKTAGPNAFVDSLSEVTHSDIGPHHRYAEGLLFDNVKGGQINVQNRESSGTGHGWAGSQTVFWNCEANSLICDAPKAAMNFAIGCVGTHAQGSWAPGEPDGFWESHQVPVTPRSLYYKQLDDRLGANALMTVTTPGQWQGRIWSDLSNWHGDGEAFDLPVFAPVQVDAGADAVAAVGTAHELNAVVRYPLPSNFPVTGAGWTVLSGPGAVTLSHPAAQSTTVSFHAPGAYLLQYALSQHDDTDPGNVITYNGADTVTVQVPAGGSILNPANFAAVQSITGATAALTFNTDTLAVSGGLSGTGLVGTNEDGSLVAVFPFHDVNLTTQPTIIGSRPFVLVSKGDLRVATTLNVKGGNGNHTTHGTGVAGGGDGGDANRVETPGNPLDGQGPGGSLGNVSGAEDSTSGGGGFGGAGGDGTGAGGMVYGNQFLSSLSGGSGAGGTRNKGGGAGGGGIGLVAADTLEITGGATIDARGGNGATSGAQFTSGGGSGGGILLRGSSVILHGTLNANGGNSGNASGGQLNGGGGGGGRIALYYQTSLDNTAGAGVSANGGTPTGTNPTGQPGAAGTIHFGLDAAGLADQWLTAETGITDPTPADWLVDYDGDGFSARFEYGLGGSTSTPDWSLMPEMDFNGIDGYDFVFNRRQSGIDSADYMTETSTTMQPGDWFRLIPNETLTVPHPTIAGFDRVSVFLPVDGPRRFVRLRLR